MRLPGRGAGLRDPGRPRDPRDRRRPPARRDADAKRVCRDIARAIEQQLDYPGEIKVTVSSARRDRSDTAK